MDVRPDTKHGPVMQNHTVKLPQGLSDWLGTEAVRHSTNISAEIRRQLQLARKYQQAITEAETAPPRFVRDYRNGTG